MHSHWKDINKEDDMIVVYSGGDNEVLVCEKSQEPELCRDYFEQGGRDLDEYDREEFNHPFDISPRLVVQ